MNKIIEKTTSGTLSARELCPWLLSRGVTAVNTEEVSHLLGIPEDQVRQRLAPLRRRGELTAGGRGIWIPVPPDKLEWGAPEPITYLDAVMEMRGLEYCVGWLSAAALYGVAHQAPQVFQVATDRPFRDREIGRSLLRFFSRADLGKVSKRRISTTSGTAVVASPESTALMLASDLELAGGLDNAATVIVELAASGVLSDRDLARSAPAFSDSASRRVGFLLERFADNSGWPEFANYCATLKSEPSYLAPSFGNMQGGPYNARWGLFENRKVDPDL